MSDNVFDISKLTPIPPMPRSNTGLPPIVSPPTLPPVISPIISPLTPLIQLPDIPQNPADIPLPSQPTMTTSNINPFPQLLPLLPDIPRNPDNIKKQYTQELQLAPLSPRSPRVQRTTTPTIVIHQTIPTRPTAPTKTETCCICYDEEIPTPNLLTCKHPVCGECVTQLQAPECPMCKHFLEGPLVSDVILADILNRQEQARLNDMTANYLAGLYLEENPNADPEEVYRRYRQ